MNDVEMHPAGAGANAPAPTDGDELRRREDNILEHAAGIKVRPQALHARAEPALHQHASLCPMGHSCFEHAVCHPQAPRPSLRVVYLVEWLVKAGSHPAD